MISSRGADHKSHVSLIITIHTEIHTGRLILVGHGSSSGGHHDHHDN